MRQFDEPIGVGILGAGRPNIATNQHIPACQACARVRIAALCDRLVGVEDYARNCGARAYRDIDAFLADPDVAMVQVATPDWCHCEHTLAALSAGKAVLLQKPPCVNREQLARLREAARAYPRLLKVCLNTRETFRVRRLRELVSEGTIGDLVHVCISYRGKRFPIADPSSPYLGAALGGVWIHNGMHWLDEATVYTGSAPTAVQAFATRNDNGPADVLGEGPNYWSAIFEFGPEVTCRLEYNTMLMTDGLPAGMQRVLIGREGEIRVPYGSDQVSIYRAGSEEIVTEVLSGGAQAAAEDTQTAFVRVVDSFARQLVDGWERDPAIAHSLDCMAWLLSAAEAGSRFMDLGGVAADGVIT